MIIVCMCVRRRRIVIMRNENYPGKSTNQRDGQSTDRVNTELHLLSKPSIKIGHGHVWVTKSAFAMSLPVPVLNNKYIC